MRLQTGYVTLRFPTDNDIRICSDCDMENGVHLLECYLNPLPEDMSGEQLAWFCFKHGFSESECEKCKEIKIEG